MIDSAHGRASRGEVGRHEKIFLRTGESEIPVGANGPVMTRSRKWGSIVNPYAVAFDVRSKMQGRPSFIGYMLSALGRTNGARPTAVAAPVEIGSSLDGTDTSRSAGPSGAPTEPADLPEDLDPAPEHADVSRS